MSMANSNRVYEDFEPPSDLVNGQGCDTILVYLPGFRKEQLKVQLTPSRVLKVSGERPIADNKWRRFHKEFVVSTDCDTKEITAKFEGGILHIRQPKLITPSPPQQQPQQPPPPQQPQQPQQPKPDHKPPVITPPPPPPQPQPQSQTQSQANQAQDGDGHEASSRLPSIPEEKSEEETEKKETEKVSDKGNETVREDGCVQTSTGQVQEVVAAGIGWFKELRNPENHKRVVAYVVMMVLVVFYVLQLFKSLKRIGQETVVEYDDELTRLS